MIRFGFCDNAYGVCRRTEKGKLILRGKQRKSVPAVTVRHIVVRGYP